MLPITLVILTISGQPPLVTTKLLPFITQDGRRTRSPLRAGWGQDEGATDWPNSCCLPVLPLPTFSPAPRVLPGNWLSP